MPVKDRFGELQDKSKHLKKGDSNEIEMGPMLPKHDDKQENELEQFLGVAFEIASNITEIEKNVDKMKTLQRKVFATYVKSEREKFQSELADLENTNKVIGRKVQKLIKDEKETIEKLESKKNQTSSNLSNLHIRKIQIQTHSQRFFEIWRDFNNIQVEYRDKVKNKLVTDLKITGCDLSDDQIEERIDSGDMTAFSSILEDTNKAKEDLTAIQNRHEAFRKLEAGIIEIHSMFTDISNLVSFQGELINRIEDNILAAGGLVDQGKDNLGKAKDLQTSARKKKICLVSTAVIVALILILIILFELGAFSGSGGSEKIEYHYHLDGKTIVTDEKLDMDQLIPEVTELATTSSTSAPSTRKTTPLPEGSGGGGIVP